MKKLFISAISLLIFSGLQAQADAKSAQLIAALESVNGGWEKLRAQKDVEFTYVYDNMAKGKDISTERYIFDGEYSWAKYTQHEVNVMPNAEGNVTQVYMNGKAEIMMGDKMLADQEAIGGTAFLRAANYYWFTMMYKLQDPGTKFQYIGKEEVNGTNYDKVNFTFNSSVTGKPENDVYILYFNPETHLVDQFYFSLPAMGVNQPVLLMTLDYKVINGIQVANKREIFMPNEKGEYNLGLVQLTQNVKFNNGFTPADFELHN